MEKNDQQPQTNMEVNRLANLLRFISVARKELGQEEMSALLDVYSMCCGEVPGLKQAVLQLSEALGRSHASEDSSAAAFSRLLLELHGIMGGASWPEVLADARSEEAATSPNTFETAEGDHNGRELKLKLVLPATADFEGREYCISLALDDDR